LPARNGLEPPAEVVIGAARRAAPEAVLVIVRIAGLPAAAMAPFGSERCMEQAGALLRLAAELAALRGQAVDRLHAEIAGAAAPARRALLAIRRDCYNARDRSLRTSSGWSTFAQAVPELAARIGDIEERLAAQREVFAATFSSEGERELRHLLTLLADENLWQGLALASPEVLRHAGRLRKPIATHERKERRLAQSLLRYVTRAAFKLSPFSTLTRLGLATVADDGPAAPPVRIALEGATQRELRRIKKHVAVKFFTLLRDYPPFRSRLPVQLNPSAEPLGAGRYRFIKPFHWQLNRAAREFRYFNEDQVAASLRGPLVDRLPELLRHDRPFGEVVRQLAAELGSDAAVVESVLGKFLDLGFLLLRFPWASNDFDPERALLAFLRGLPPDGLLDEFAGALEHLLDLRDAAPPVESRLAGYQELDGVRMGCFRTLCDGLRLPAVKEEVNARQVNEDVLLLPGDGNPAAAVAHISRRSAVAAFASIRPLVLYSDLNYTRYELLHSLRALAGQHWPGRREIGFLDLFHRAQPLWGDYVKAATAAITEWQTELWNPFGLAEIEALERLRNGVLKGMEDCMRVEGDELVLDCAGAERAVSQIPGMYIPACGPCLFAQPAASGGDLWVLNHMLDGTGRFSNRFTTVMPAGLRDRFAANLAAGGAGASLQGEPAEMVEILCCRDDHLNVHTLQTARVLVLPGENPDLPPERCLGVRDLCVRLDEPLPFLADRSGRRLLPIFLGTNGLVGMPTLVRFLSRFGIGELRIIHPARPPLARDGVVTLRRLRIGNLVVRRQMWVFSPAAAFAGHAAATDAELYLAVNRWRLPRGIPSRVFAAERMQAKFDLWPLHKPQYLDFTSPSFVPILRSLIESSPDELKVEEVLPAPEAFPAAADGRRWAVEAQLESIAFHPVDPWRSSPPRSRIPRGGLPALGSPLSTNEPMAQGGSDV
jgi:hypothetical protein